MNMLDDELERRIRRWFERMTLPTEPDSLHEALQRLPPTTRRRRQWIVVPSIVAGLLAAISLIGLLIFANSLLGSGQGTGSGQPIASQTTTTPSSRPTPHEITLAGKLTASEGWAIADGVLQWTNDNGTSWHLTKDLNAWPLLPTSQVGFIDSMHGWGLNLADPARPLFEVTSDGGQSWAAVQLPDMPGSPSSPYFSNVHSGWLVITHASGSGELLATGDGGASWHVLGSVPSSILGPVVFLDESNAIAIGTSDPVAAAGRTADSLFVTHDQGRTWTHVNIPTPTGFGSTKSSSVAQLPRATSGSSAVAVIDVSSSAASITELLRTNDRGSTWSIAGILPADNSGLPFAMATPGRWLAAFASGGASAPTLMESLDAGRTWHPVMVTGFPQSPVFKSLMFSDAQDGWALVDLAPTPDAQVTVSGQLFATTDGGAHWISIMSGLQVP